MIPELIASKKVLKECADGLVALQKKQTRPDLFDLGIHLSELCGRQQYLEAIFDGIPEIKTMQDLVAITKKGRVFSFATLYAWIHRHSGEVERMRGQLDGGGQQFIGGPNWETYATSGLLVGGLISLYLHLDGQMKD